MIRISFVGNLGADPEQRFSQNGTEMTTFRVAVNWRRGPQGDQKEGTDWFRVKASGSRANYLNTTLRKGSRVLVYGRLEIDYYDTRDGERRQSLDVWADEVTNLTPRDQAGGETDGYAASPATREPAAAAAGARQSASERRGAAQDLEDLPFAHPRWLDEPWTRWFENL